MRRKEDSGTEKRKPSVCEMRIWKFYEWAVVLAPILLMVSHWYIFWVFSRNPYELMEYSEENEVCIAWIYTILYLYVPLMILPASYFFRWCNLFRVPFVYFIFINVERVYYGSWFCTNEMIDTHYILIYCILCIYVVEMIGVSIKYSKTWVGKVKNVGMWIWTYVWRYMCKAGKMMFGKSEEEKERDEMMIAEIEKLLEEKEK